MKGLKPRRKKSSFHHQQPASAISSSVNNGLTNLLYLVIILFSTCHALISSRWRSSSVHSSCASRAPRWINDKQCGRMWFSTLSIISGANIVRNTEAFELDMIMWLDFGVCDFNG